MQLNVKKAIVAGVAGTAVMTMVSVWGAPMMGMPKMNPAEMLAGQVGGSPVLGWIAHFMVGSILALIYAAVAGSLSGPAWLRGALYGIAPWLLAQLAVMPMMGTPLFSGSMVMAGASLFGHLVYGAVVGAVYGATAARRMAYA
jgi:uncharacterized membrane protein YagU involved in acid resistance